MTQARIVVSVGTSLLTNNREALKTQYCIASELFENGIDLGVMRDLSFVFENDDPKSLTEIEPSAVSGLIDFSRKFFELYFDVNKIQQCISKRVRKKTDPLPAELSSLYLYYYLPDRKLRDEFNGRLVGQSDGEFQIKDEVTLLTTATSDAYYCAKMLEMMIKKLPLFQEKCCLKEIKAIENLDVYDPEKWANRDYVNEQQPNENGKGLTNLLDWFESEFGENDGERVLIRTGGYKEFSADLKLMALKFGFKSLYLFEKSTKCLETYMGRWSRGINLSNIIRRTRPRS